MTIGEKRYLTEAPSKPELWLKMIKDGNIKNFSKRLISANEQAEEYVMMGLRLKDGFETSKYFNITKKELSKCKIEKLRSENLIETSKNRLRVTDRGKLLTNYIIKELLC